MVSHVARHTAIHFCFDYYLMLIAGSLQTSDLHQCMYSLKGETGGPGQKGSKGDKGELVRLTSF